MFTYILISSQMQLESLPINLHSISCVGMETRLIDCQHENHLPSRCGDNSDVFLFCDLLEDIDIQYFLGWLSRQDVAIGNW